MLSPEPIPLPPTYQPRFAEEARKRALMRAADEDLAQHFDIALATLNEWLATIPEFAEAVRYGRKMGDADVVDGLHQGAAGFSCEAVKIFRPFAAGEEPIRAGYIQHRPPHTPAGIFWLVNRLPDEWRQKVVIEATPSPEDAKKLTRPELNRHLAALLAAGGPAAAGHPG
jgi:hypothetical protein